MNNDTNDNRTAEQIAFCDRADTTHHTRIEPTGLPIEDAPFSEYCTYDPTLDLISRFGQMDVLVNLCDFAIFDSRHNERKACRDYAEQLDNELEALIDRMHRLAIKLGLDGPHYRRSGLYDENAEG